jgi:hypothetical protein
VGAGERRLIGTAHRKKEEKIGLAGEGQSLAWMLVAHCKQSSHLRAHTPERRANRGYVMGKRFARAYSTRRPLPTPAAPLRREAEAVVNNGVLA